MDIQQKLLQANDSSVLQKQKELVINTITDQISRMNEEDLNIFRIDFTTDLIECISSNCKKTFVLNWDLSVPSLIKMFSDYIKDLDAYGVHEFICTCDGDEFVFPEEVFTCAKCKKYYGECHDENGKRVNANEPLACEERFYDYCLK